ncbi:MAG TPA: ABC transporter substrate-binding protein [Rhizobiaceae bacterium]|nr:ABC transporter substrate-binding protein [Rhizobiaceae bacterium]
MTRAADIAMVSGSVGNDLKTLRHFVAEFQQKTGDHVSIVTMPSSSTSQFAQFRLWLAARDPDIDVYQTDIVWAPQLASSFIDLKPYVKDSLGDVFPTILASQTVGGKLVAVPMFADAPALYYRKDLLEKYHKPVPQTWEELAATAKTIMDGERAAGKSRIWGFVFQGAAYEGLTCNALEWMRAEGAGNIVEKDGRISVYNDRTVKALEMVRGWIGTISPEGVLSYQEEESRGVWQTGNAVFMRNWPYAYPLGESADSPIKGKFDIAPLPAGAEGGIHAGTLGGWSLAVSRYSRHKDVAIKLVKFLTSKAVQKERAIASARLPTLKSLYDDPEIRAKQPIIGRMKAALENAVARPSAVTGANYNEVSADFWTAVHNTLAGDGSAKDNLELLEAKLGRLKGAGW